jgi:hypothetical protein
MKKALIITSIVMFVLAACGVGQIGGVSWIAAGLAFFAGSHLF